MFPMRGILLTTRFGKPQGNFTTASGYTADGVIALLIVSAFFYRDLRNNQFAHLSPGRD